MIIDICDGVMTLIPKEGEELDVLEILEALNEGKNTGQHPPADTGE